MPAVKPLIKNLFYRTGTLTLLDQALYAFNRLKNLPKNIRFRKARPDLPIPPDYFLYETFGLDYKQFFEDGLITARELLGWHARHTTRPPENVLDWGCGVARVVRHIPELLGKDSKVSGCDINAAMIGWDRLHVPNVSFKVIDKRFDIPYAGNDFDLIYAISVLTHIDGTDQERWIDELNRILRPKAIFIFTTHGKHFLNQLLRHEKEELQRIGVFTKSSARYGHRMTTSYNSPQSIQAFCNNRFDVLEFIDGDARPEVMGGQDLWIARKK